MVARAAFSDHEQEQKEEAEVEEEEEVDPMEEQAGIVKIVALSVPPVLPTEAVAMSVVRYVRRSSCC